MNFTQLNIILLVLEYVPFKDFLVFPDPKHMKPAEYIDQIKSPPDWGIIFKRDSLPEGSIQDEHSEKYSLLEEFDKLRLNSSCKTHLDESQLAAVELALKNKLVLIQVGTWTILRDLTT